MFWTSKYGIHKLRTNKHIFAIFLKAACKINETLSSFVTLDSLENVSRSARVR